MSGPPPNPQSRRRNAPSVATTALPAEGRKGRAPNPPAAYVLQAAGKAWWAWAWRLPQATQWDKGSLYALARRAQLEDELAALDFTDYTELGDLLMGAEPEAISRVKWALSSLKRSASGSASLMKEMRELDDRFGLTAKALQGLRWSIDAPAPKQTAEDTSDVARMDDYRSRVG